MPGKWFGNRLCRWIPHSSSPRAAELNETRGSGTSHLARGRPHKGMPDGHPPVRSYLAVPVISRAGEVLGGLFFGHARPSIFTERSEHLVTGLAAQAAIGIDNARLFDSLQQGNVQLEERVNARTAELALAHEQLNQSQKMEAVGQLTGGIAHDFNNMLAVVLGSLELLKRRVGDGDPRAQRYTDAAIDGARRAAELTQRLLAFSRQQSLRPEPNDANKLVAGIDPALISGTARMDLASRRIVGWSMSE
jgi:GAF domain-containing protein